MSAAIITTEQAALLEQKGLKVKFEVSRRQDGPDRGKETVSTSVHVARLVSADDDSEIAKATGGSEQQALDEVMKLAPGIRAKPSRAEMESEIAAMKSKLAEVQSAPAEIEPPKRPPGRPKKSDD